MIHVHYIHKNNEEQSEIKDQDQSLAESSGAHIQGKKGKQCTCSVRKSCFALRLRPLTDILTMTTFIPSPSWNLSKAFNHEPCNNDCQCLGLCLCNSIQWICNLYYDL